MEEDRKRKDEEKEPFKGNVQNSCYDKLPVNFICDPGQQNRK